MWALVLRSPPPLPLCSPLVSPCLLRAARSQARHSSLPRKRKHRAVKPHCGQHLFVLLAHPRCQSCSGNGAAAGLFVGVSSTLDEVLIAVVQALYSTYNLYQKGALQMVLQYKQTIICNCSHISLEENWRGFSHCCCNESRNQWVGLGCREWGRGTESNPCSWSASKPSSGQCCGLAACFVPAALWLQRGLSSVAFLATIICKTMSEWKEWKQRKTWKSEKNYVKEKYFFFFFFVLNELHYPN